MTHPGLRCIVAVLAATRSIAGSRPTFHATTRSIPSLQIVLGAIARGPTFSPIKPSFKSELCSRRRPHGGHPFIRLRVDPRPSILSSLKSELRAHTAAHALRPAHGRRPFHAMTTIGRSPNISAWSYCCGRGRLLSWVRCACRAAHTSSPPSMHTEALEQNIVY